jgi:hypothetical protein
MRYRREINGGRGREVWLASRECCACGLSVGEFANKERFFGRAPINCFPYEGNSVINPSCYLRDKFLEPLGPERARRTCAVTGNSGVTARWNLA